MVDSATSEHAYPQRPSWSPAEEARARVAAELQALEMEKAAGASKGRRGGANRSGPFQPGPAPQRSAVQPSTVVRHTTVPRLLVSLAPVLWLMAAVFVVMLKQRGYVTETTRFDVAGEQVTEYHLDPSKTNLAIGIVFLVFALPIFAWGWWVVAATLNAQAKSRNAGWPWVLPMSVAVAVGALVAGRFVPAGPQSALQIVFAVAYVWGAYGVLFSLRKSARAMKADPVFWTRLIWLPWLSAALATATVVIGAAVGSPEIAVFGALVPFGLMLWAWLTLCKGMASFDRSCRSAEVGCGDVDGLPAFMTGNRGR